MIQFAGGKGLWLAERLKPDAIRTFRPGCIGIVPVDEPAHPDFLYSDNFVSFAKSQGWYKGGPFNANAVYGDAKGKWEGVRWIENELAQRVTRFGGVAFEDIVWALRTTQLTGETAGYGQIVPLKPMSNQAVRHLWHAPCGPVSAPFSPVFIGQSGVPREFQKHRYLSADESQKFLSRESPVVDGQQMSDVSQAVEATVSAFADSKRLVYLILQDPDRYLPEVTEVFASREARLGHVLEKLICSAETLLHAGMEEEAYWLLTYFSHSELRKGQTLVQDLIVGLEARSRQMEVRRQNAEPAGFKQIW